MNWQNIPNRKPPERPEPDELIGIISKRVLEHEFQNAVAIFRELYQKYYKFSLNGYKNPSTITGIRKIIALCKYKGWDLRDFIECNVIWYLENSRFKPVPVALCGQKAEMKYEMYLQDNYDGSVERRLEELEQRRGTSERVTRMEAAGMLPEQVKQMAEQYAKEKADAAIIDVDKIKETMPAFIADKMDVEALEQRGRQKVFFDAKDEYMRNWNFAHEQQEAELHICTY
jgi:hypothetical protein